ncbi:MAG TPA: hypothetical protein VKN18_23795 [Blastocatellia bacterium]|nr:hypothetical protein [Blastocatellia bacterium]
MDMPINDQGFFVVQPGDTIAITVTASNTAYLAKFPKQPAGAKWSSIQGPDATKETRKFVASTASGTRCLVSIFFDFQSDAAGDFPPTAKYDINLDSPLSGSFDDLAVVPPPPDNRTYKFQVA